MFLNVNNLSYRCFTCQEISSNIEMIHNAPANLHLSFTANCSDGSSSQGENKCRNFHVRDEVSFDIEITAVGCPLEGHSQRLDWFANSNCYI